MNYPVFDVPIIGGGILIAMIAIIHVFISHFAVGAGLFNLVSEARARRTGDAVLLGFVRAHSTVLILVSTVLGALTGVGIWFAIGLVQPSGTETLIRVFIWAWGVEWLLFVIEVVAGLAYYYGWERMDAATHLRVAWIYAVATWASLFVINGILTFMLTPGDWLATGSFRAAFFNPTFWPSLVLRSMVALALVGLYTLLVSTLHREESARPSLVRYTGRWVFYPLLIMGPAALWYISRVPPEARRWFEGASAPLTMFFMLSTLFTGLILALVLLVAMRQPKHFTWPTAVLVLFFGLLATASTEMVREAIRRPFIIWNYMYSNSIRVDQVESLKSTGILAAARWTDLRSVTPENKLEAGRTIFDLQCRICHTVEGFNGIKPLIGGWREKTLYDFIGVMHETKRFMPPFLGTEEERQALAAWLHSLQHPTQNDKR